MSKTKLKPETINVTQEYSEALIPVQRMGEVALGEISTDEKEARRAAYLKSDKSQDHGTAAQQAGVAPKEDYLGGTPKSKLERNIARQDMDDELRNLSSSQLTKLADALLVDHADAEVEYPYMTAEDGTEIYELSDQEDEKDDNPSSIELQGREFSEVLNIARKQTPADPYETTPVDEDRGDYLLDGMQIIKGRKGQ